MDLFASGNENCNKDIDSTNPKNEFSMYKTYSTINKLSDSTTGFTLKSKFMSNFNTIQKGKRLPKDSRVMNFVINLEPEVHEEVIIVTEPYELTWGWLLSQATRLYESYINERRERFTMLETEADSCRFEVANKNKTHKRLIVGLSCETIMFKIPIDYYLSQHDLPLYRLPKNLKLNILFAKMPSSQK